MSKECSICKRDDRLAIENALISMATGTVQSSIEEVARVFDCDLDDLKMHALFHTPAAQVDVEEAEARESLVRKMKLTEADMLAEVSAEYLVTLKAMGRRIGKLLKTSDNDIDEENKQFMVSKMLTKPMVELYLGVGSEIRQTIKAAAEIERMLNGPQDPAGAGLAALAAAIRGSE